jgi:dTDP-4-amino-4,6-dideoxygalactose transaminase
VRDELQSIADEWNVPLIFDSAHALGSSYNGTRLGRFGSAEVFSLHATKAINGIEGGVVTTGDDQLADRLRALRNYGFSGMESVGGLGINAKMNEFSAAMALSNLPHYDRLAEHNRRLHVAYESAMAGVPGIRFHSLAGSPCSRHYAVFELESKVSHTRDRLLEALDAENVYARRYFWPGCHKSAPYAAGMHVPMPVTDRLVGTIFQLPTGLQLDEADAFAIGKCVALWLECEQVREPS